MKRKVLGYDYGIDLLCICRVLPTQTEGVDGVEFNVS